MGELLGNTGNGPANARMTSRRRLLQAGLVAGAVAGTGGWRPAAGQTGQHELSGHLRKPGSLP